MTDSLSRLQAAVQSEHMLDVSKAVRALLAEDAALGAQWADVALASLQVGDDVATLQAAQKLTEALPDNADSWLWVASAYTAMGRHADALRVMEGQMKRFPNHPSIHRRAGRALLELGQPQTAELCFRKALELDPSDAAAFEGLAQSRTFESGDDDLMRMEETRLGWPEGTPADKRGILAYALAKAYADIGEYEASGRRVAEGAGFYRAFAPFDTDRHAQGMKQLLSVYDDRFARANEDAGLLDARPVFILAPPAAGASWMTRALSAPEDVIALDRNNGLFWMCSSLLNDHTTDDLHSAFLKGGENVLLEVGRTYLERLSERAGQARRIIDPSGLSEIGAGAAGICLPAAKFVRITREPRDLAWAIYSRRFRKGRNWSYHPDDIARVLALHNQMCDHWQGLFADRMITVAYEDLAENPAEALKPVCDFVGIDSAQVCSEAWLNADLFKADPVGVHERGGSRFDAVEAALQRAGVVQG
jgi:tetratricopeptide (TPR) repeat protein